VDQSSRSTDLRKNCSRKAGLVPAFLLFARFVV
jgi:hypothetical protein